MRMDYQEEKKTPGDPQMDLAFTHENVEVLTALGEVRDALHAHRIAEALEMASIIEAGAAEDTLVRYRGRFEGLTVAKNILYAAIRRAQADEY